MKAPKVSRRDMLLGTAALAVGSLSSTARVLSAAPPATAITPDLIKAAQKEGRLNYYTSIDLPVAEQIARAFQAKFPGVAVKVERSGAERVFQRIGQEYASRIHAVDVCNSSDAAHFIVWKRQGLLEPFVPEDVAQHYAPDRWDADGQFAAFRMNLPVIGYNIKLVKPEEAPKSFADLLDPKWAGKMIKAHPGYSGTVMTATQQIVRDLGWEYLEKLARQKVMQVQSAADPPKKLEIGERAVMVDGNEYSMLVIMAKKAPVAIVHPAEGTPFVVGPNGIFKNAPNPNAAKLFQAWCFTAECQQLIVDIGKLRSVHPLIKETDGRVPFNQIKFMREDAEAVEKQSEEIKKRYAQIFKV